MAIRATQKNRISLPVSNTELGKKASKSFDSQLGHSKAEKGSNPEENHVSSTSSS